MKLSFISSTECQQMKSPVVMNATAIKRIQQKQEEILLCQIASLWVSQTLENLYQVLQESGFFCEFLVKSHKESCTMNKKTTLCKSELCRQQVLTGRGQALHYALFKPSSHLALTQRPSRYKEDMQPDSSPVLLFRWWNKLWSSRYMIMI